MNPITKLALEKASDYAIKKTLKKSDSVVGLGISWLWMLPVDHKFMPCAIRHDAHYDAIEVISGLKRIKDLPKVPFGYHVHVETAVYEFTKQLISKKEFINRADREFYHSCIKIAHYHKSTWLRLQAELFYLIVKKWSDLKFKEWEK